VYTIQATIGSTNLTTTVNVYGVASGIDLTAASSSLIANSTSLDDVTLKVVDSNGNTVTNFSGTVSVTITSKSNATLVDSNGNGVALSSGSATINNVAITNGVGSVTVLAGSTAGKTDVISVSNLQPSNGQAVATNVTYGTVSISSTAATASQLSLTANPTKLANNTASQDAVTVQLQDSTGNAFTTAVPVYLNLSLTGSGSFANGSTLTSTTVSIPAGQSSATVNVWSFQGGTTPIVVTATGTSLTSGNVTIPVLSVGTASNISLSTSTGKLATTLDTGANTELAGTSYTIYTVQLVDASGNPIPTGADVLTIGDNNTAVNPGTTDPLQYYAVSQGKPTGNHITLSSGKYSAQLTNGSYSFAVMAGAYAGLTAPTITVTDTTNAFTATTQPTLVAGPMYKAVAIQSNAGTVQVGNSVTFTAQLSDHFGNPVKVSGQNIVFDFASNAAHMTFSNGSASYTAVTDANGIASATINVPSNASTTSNNTFTVEATFNGANSNSEGQYTITSASNYVSQLAWDTNSFPSTTVSPGTVSGTNVVDFENTLGGAVTSTDTLKLTTSDPTVISLPTSSSGNWTVQSDGSMNYSYSGSSATLPTLTAKKAGTATITVTDVSNSAQPSVTQTITVVPGSLSAYKIFYNNAPISATNAVTFAVNTPVQATVVSVDAGNNLVPVTGTTSAAVTISGLPSGVTASLTSNGTAINDVIIPVGQSSTSIYLTSTSAQSTNSAITLSADSSPSLSVSDGGVTVTTGSAINFTLTVNDGSGNVDSAVNGSYNVTATNMGAGTFNGVTASAGTATSSVTFTKGVATVPVVFNTAGPYSSFNISITGSPSTGESLTSVNQTSAITVNP
jgi:hypothetical protein